MADRDLTKLIPYHTVNDWAIYAIKEFQSELDRKKVNLTGALFNSFKKELRANQGNVEEVLIKFSMYGRFRDMGVGRGLKAYERKTNKSNLIAAKRYGANVSYVGRQPKRWYSKKKTAETYRLKEILIKDMGNDVVNWMAQEFQTEINLGIA
ncbi:hypothetical protein ACR777_15050 [Sphingobacterium spiritivorum]|uniref:hypothetical protein n=1 Tax=Sphingobacterium spiritivorum TaxID=258 RepID=UPI003DA2971E